MTTLPTLDMTTLPTLLEQVQYDVYEQYRHEVPAPGGIRNQAGIDEIINKMTPLQLLEAISEALENREREV